MLLTIGARVRMNALGRARHPRYGLREGTIVGCGSPSSRRVKFDDRKTVLSIYKGYLEVLPNKRGSRNTSDLRSEL
ncbi:hypothetical protein [Rhodopseudomonas faecalis]|uniref:hypothetical protein n=1 Tax=Rhodopseudomonas faecalis TaxID=99655 RepID=UPI001FDEEC11|nr:hypothetical protein [Rhodopseudomonas faecalis]